MKLKTRNIKIGLPPGTVIYTGTKGTEQVEVHYLKYEKTHLEDDHFTNHTEIPFQPSDDHIVDWYDIRGIHDTKLIESIGKTFSVHSLVLEDVADINQRPKFEEYEKGNFVIIRALHFDTDKLEITTEQVALYFRQGLLISFQENETDLFKSVRERLHNSKGRIRTRGADYLCYALLDALVDEYYVIMDEVETIVDAIEEDLLEDPNQNIRSRIHHLKNELLVIRRSITSWRDAVSRFSKSESEFIESKTTFYLRDLFDHTIQILDMVESQKDALHGLQDLYMTEISFKMNQVMQLLTIITTIFVPLSFLAGLYGMNFEYIPELSYRYGYFVLLGAMFLLVLGFIVYFRRKGWL
ncbi:MAG: magnesium/cobalt transporter CorA [Phaeodactylibacter sp.]|nr:magnesium/cobalt transporter CorA [Phaeodactylibacter sp.]